MSEQTPIMELLKTGTQDLHDAAENHTYQISMIKGELPVEGYVAHLEQMYLVHKSLESKLRKHRNDHPAFAAVINEEQYQEPYLLEDFAHFDVDAASVHPAEGTEQVIQAIENASESAPIKLLGLH
ncbi:MAG: biliverdin-producing heme oxygenase, partial [Planctomycetota bacterium]